MVPPRSTHKCKPVLARQLRGLTVIEKKKKKKKKKNMRLYVYMYSLFKVLTYILVCLTGYSAIEPGEGKDRWLSPNFVRKLAESSARFIATMHQDNANGRYGKHLCLIYIYKTFEGHPMRFGIVNATYEMRFYMTTACGLIVYYTKLLNRHFFCKTI